MWHAISTGLIEPERHVHGRMPMGRSIGWGSGMGVASGMPDCCRGSGPNRRLRIIRSQCRRILLCIRRLLACECMACATSLRVGAQLNRPLATFNIATWSLALTGVMCLRGLHVTRVVAILCRCVRGRTPHIKPRGWWPSGSSSPSGHCRPHPLDSFHAHLPRVSARCRRCCWCPPSWRLFP